MTGINLSRTAYALSVPWTVARAGLLTPGPRMRAQLAAMGRWGPTLAGEVVGAAARDPDLPAVIDDRGTLTYRELDERTDRLAATLRARHSGPGPLRLGLLAANSRGAVEAQAAAAKLGADLVLLNPGLAPAQLAAAITAQGVDLLAVDADLTAAAPAGLPRFVLDRDGTEGSAAGAVEPPKRPGRTIVLSSGTTGPPKGARRPTPGPASLTAMLSRLPLRVHDRIFIAAPLFHTWGYACLQMAIALRMTIVLEPRFDPERTLAAVARHGCTVLAAVPVMTQRIVELPAATRDRYPVRRLRVVAVSGSALPAGLAPRFRAAFGDRLYNLYGSTEVSCVSIATPADLRADPASAGRPIAGTAISIVDAAGRPVAQGESGQICVANPMVFDGYTDGTARELVDGLVRTGDTGHLDRAGRLVVDGRDDEMIVSGGENVFPRQVEAAVGELPQVSEVAVVGVADAEFGQRLAAFVVRRPDDTGGTEPFGPDDVRQHVRTRLARFAVPRDVHFVPELPRNATGKVMIRELAARAEQGAARPR